MKNLLIKTAFAPMFLILFISLLISYAFNSLITLPLEGDSIVYHIPIAKSVLNGEIIKPTFYLGYYPSNAEVILSQLILLNLPLNLFNIFAWGILFILLIMLGKSFNLEKGNAIIYSFSIVSQFGLLRWLNTQVIDIWLTVFYAALLIILNRVNYSKKIIFSIGLFSGLLIGVKYSGPLFVFVLFLIFFKKLKTYLSGYNFFILLLPLIIFGLSWYIRNFLLTGNPVYPQAFLGLKGIVDWNIFQYQYWEIIVNEPLKVFNALISEFSFWPFLIIATIIHKIFLSNKKIKLAENQIILSVLSLLNFLIFVFLPTSLNYDIIVSSLRYSYPALITGVLFVFLYFQKFKSIYILAVFTLINLLYLPSLPYRPKLIFLSLFIFYLITFNNYISSKIKKIL